MSDAATFFLYGLTVILALLLIPALGVVFHSACALANREESFLRAIVFGCGTFLPCAALGFFIVLFIGARDPAHAETKFGVYHVAGVVVALLLSWIIGSVAYTAIFRGDFLKATQVSLFETLMRVMLAFLIGGIYAVMFAILQVGRDEKGLIALLVFGLYFAAFLAVVGLLFLVVWLIRRSQLR